MTRRHGICICVSVCAAGSNGITCNLESSFNLKALRVQVEASQPSITSQGIRSMWYTGIGVQSHIPLSPQWSRRHCERPPTRHWLFHSFKQCELVEYVPALTLRSLHSVTVHTSETVINTVSPDHTVKYTKHQQDMPVPHTGTAHRGPTFSWSRLPSHSSSSVSRVISCFQITKQILVFMVHRSISGSKFLAHLFWGSWKTALSLVKVPE